MDKQQLETMATVLGELDKAVAGMLTDAHHGASPFVAPLRVRLTAAMDALAGHQAWLATQPAPTATPAA